MSKKTKLIVGIICFISVTCLARVFIKLNQFNELAKVQKIETNQIQKMFDSAFISEMWPSEFEQNNQKYTVEYSFDEELQNKLSRLIRRYRPDFSSIVVIDNNTNKVLTAFDYERAANKFGKSLVFSSTHPAASIFKIISSAVLLEEKDVNRNSLFSFNGKPSTLYKYQLKNKFTRWTRYHSLEQAFANSNNVIFGKAAINYGIKNQIFKMAKKFGFHRTLMEELTLSQSIIKNATSNYNIAELASGFNKETLISPLHGAVISSIVANDGALVLPSIVNDVKDEDNNSVWKPLHHEKQVLNQYVVKDLQKMMTLAVEKGTARRIKRGMSRILKDNLEIGAKTGSITGGIPYGKRDWIIAYAKPKNMPEDKGISMCVMNVNVKKWYVRSTFLTKMVLEYYYKQKLSKNYLVKNKYDSRKITKYTN